MIALAATLLANAAMIGSPGPASAVDPEPAPVAELDALGARAIDLMEHRRALAAERADAVTAEAPEQCLTITGGTALSVLRYAGADRYETAVCVSYWTWYDHDATGAPAELQADAVVLARGDAFPDALAGGPLAAYHEAPLLLTTPTQLLPAVRTEIERVLAPGGTVYLLGGTSSLSTPVRSELNAAGYNTVRLFGANRFETAIEIADALPDTSNFFFVTGRDFPDALGAGTAAASLSLAAKIDDDPATRPYALMLTDDAVMPVSTADFVEERGQLLGEWTLVTAGGLADRAAAAEYGSGNLAARYVGASRYETATLIAEDVFTDTEGVLIGTGAGLATGQDFPDALPATASLSIFGEPLLLTQEMTLSSVTRTFLEGHAGQAEYLDIFGGPSTISTAIADQAEAALIP